MKTDLDWGLSAEDRLKFVHEFTESMNFDMSKGQDKQLLNLLSDYLTGDIITENKIKTLSIDSVQRTKTRYITQKSAKDKHRKGDMARAKKECPQIIDYINYRNSLKKQNKQQKGWVKDRLDNLRESTGEHVCTEKQLFKAIGEDISECLYPTFRFKKSTLPDMSDEKILVDYTDKKHIMNLFKHYDILKSSSELIDIRCDIDAMLENVKITNAEWDNLMRFMDGESSVTLTRPLLSRVFDKIVEYNKGDD